jgi:hypothetical protein
MAQDFRIMAPDQVRAVTVTNVSQSVALDVNVVSAMFSATINLDPVVTVTSTQGNPVWVTGQLANLSASVTFPVAVSSTFNLSSSQNHDLVIAQGLQGAAVQWNMGVGTGTVLLSVDGVNFSHEAQFDLLSSSFVYGATHNGAFVVPTIAGAKTIRMHYEGVGTSSGTLLVTYAPFTGHSSGSVIQQVTGSVTVSGTVTVDQSAVSTPWIIDGIVATYPYSATTATFSSASVSASAVTLLTANTNRLGATVSNRSLSFPVYVKLGASASFNSYHVRLPPNGYYETPYGYVGEITAACSGVQAVIAMVGEVIP